MFSVGDMDGDAEGLSEDVTVSRNTASSVTGGRTEAEGVLGLSEVGESVGEAVVILCCRLPPPTVGTRMATSATKSNSRPTEPPIMIQRRRGLEVLLS